jgi:Fe-S-cluster containining protein
MTYDCLECGACCREAFDATPVDPDEDEGPLEASMPGIIERDGNWRQLQRVPSPLFRGCTRCVALSGDGSRDAPFLCHVYEVRPDACRELEPGGEACILARRRVGIEPWPDDATPDGPLVREGHTLER